MDVVIVTLVELDMMGPVIAMKVVIIGLMVFKQSTCVLNVPIGPW